MSFGQRQDRVQVEFLDEDASRMKVDMGYAAFGADSIHAVGFEGDMINESVFFCDNFTISPACLWETQTVS